MVALATVDATPGMATMLARPWTPQDVMETFLAAWTDAEGTQENYRRSISAALDLWASPDSTGRLLPAHAIADLIPAHLVRYRAWVMAPERGWEISTQSSRIAAVRSFLKWCRGVQLTMISSDAVDLTLKLPKQRGRRARPATRDEVVAAMYAAAPPDRAPLVAFLFGTGARGSEAARLQVRDLDMPNRVVTLHGKGNKIRRVPLSPDLVSILTAHLVAEGIATQPSAWVFAGRRYRDGVRRPATRHTIHTVMKLLARKAGVEHVYPHMMRHAYGRRTAKKAGVPSTQRWMGHEDIRTTQGYLFELDDEGVAQPDLPRLPFGPDA